MKYNRKGLKHAEQLNSLRHFYYFITQFVHDGFHKNNLDSVLYYANLALQRATKHEDHLNIGRYESYIGSIYHQNEMYTSALSHYIVGLKSHEKTNLREKIAMLYLNMGEIYISLSEYDKGKKYLLDVIPNLEGANKPFKANLLNALYINLGTMYYELEQYDSLRHYLKKSTEQVSYFENDNTFLYATADAYYQATYYYLRLGDYNNAKINLEKSAQFAEYQPGYNLINFEYCLRTKSCSDLKEQFKQHFSKRDSSIYFLELKRDYYQQEGLYKEALETQIILDQQEKIKLGQEKLNYAVYIDAQFENNKKEKAILLLEKENEQRITQMWWMSILFLLILGLGSLIFYQIKQKNKFLTINLKNKKLIEQQAKELQNNAVLKNQLFGNIAHELRTPLTLINGPIKQLLSEGQLMTKDRQQVKIVADNSEQLLFLTDQILDLTKSEVGLIKVNFHSFNIEELMNYLETQFQILAKNKGIKLLVHNNIPTDLILISDVKKLIAILKNLIANAIKYNTTKGQVTVSCTHNEREIRISVQDNGQGIPPEELNLVFNRYYQSDTNNTLEGGIGVGLAICREYSKLLGGRIEVESTIGVGSTFTVQIPIQPDEVPSLIAPYHFPNIEESLTVELPGIGITEIQEPYILVVEDNLDLCQYLYSMLKDNYELSFAHNGQEALDQIAIQQPSLIITDWMMPVLDGKELITHLKKQPDLALIPILMLTARTETKDQLTILRIGVDDYMTKPFEESSLQAHIIYLLELSARRTNPELVKASEIETFEQAKEIPRDVPVLEEKDQLFLIQFEENILENISNFNFTLDVSAKNLGISSRHLGRKVKTLLGLTANEYIQEIRFREAKRMLIEGEYSSVKAVTYSVGFKSEKYFSRNFKKRFGKNPKDFLRY